MTLNYGCSGIFHIMGSAGFISSAVVSKVLLKAPVDTPPTPPREPHEKYSGFLYSRPLRNYPAVTATKALLKPWHAWIWGSGVYRGL